MKYSPKTGPNLPLSKPEKQRTDVAKSSKFRTSSVSGKSYDIKNRGGGGARPGLSNKNLGHTSIRPMSSKEYKFNDSSRPKNDISRSNKKLKSDLSQDTNPKTEYNIAPLSTAKKGRSAIRTQTEHSMRIMSIIHPDGKPDGSMSTGIATAFSTSYAKDLYHDYQAVDIEARDKERQKMCYHFIRCHHSSQEDSNELVDTFIAKSPFRKYVEMLNTLEFKVNEFIPFYVSETYDKALPVAIIQFEGVFGSSYFNLTTGTELMLTKKYSITDFSARKGCIVDPDIFSFLDQLSKTCNCIIVFQKSHSKAKELAIHLRQALNDSLKGIYFKRVNNKNSKFISYNKIMSNFLECTRKEVYIISSIRADIQYWKSIQKKDRRERLHHCRALTVNDLNDFDVVFPLHNIHLKFDYHLGFLEDFITREQESIKNCAGLRYDAKGYFLANQTKSGYLDRIRDFVMSESDEKHIFMVPTVYKEFFDFFDTVTYRNYLKYLRKKEDEVKISFEQINKGCFNDLSQKSFPTLFAANANLLNRLPSQTSQPVYSLPGFVQHIQEYSSLFNRKNTELHSITKLSKSLQII